MKTIHVLILLGVLQVHSPAAQGKSTGQAQINFERFCKRFDELRSASSLKNINREIAFLLEDLQTNRITSASYPLREAKKQCVNPSKYFDPECVIGFYVDILNDFLSPYFDTVRQEGNMIEIYLDIWLLHPLLRRCHPFLQRNLTMSDAKARLATGISEARGGTNQFVVALNGQRAELLRKEIEKFCVNGPGDRIFCSSLPDLVKLVDAYETVKNETETSPKWKAYLLHYLMLKHNYPEEFAQVYPTTVEQISQLIASNSEEIFKRIDDGQIDALKDDLMPLMPDLKTIKSGCITTWNLPRKLKKNGCIFWKGIIQTKAYFQLQASPKYGKQIKVLNTNIDYPAFLKLTEMNRILSVIKNQETALFALVEWVKAELDKTINERFIDLRTYFQRVQTFNREKADADIDYINGRLATYAKNIDSLSSELGGKVGALINYAIEAVALEITEDTAQTVLAGAVLMNPLEKLFGGSSAGDFIDRSAKLAHTLTKVGEMLDKSRTFNETVKKTRDISTRFNKNAKFLEKVRLLADGIQQGTRSGDFETLKQTFLQQYRAYNPEVQKPELSAMVTTWENMIDETCDVITGTETALSAVVVALVKSQGLCPKAKVLAQRMISTYEEIYDFQFELIETMATYLGAATALDAASGIAADYDEFTSEPNTDENVVDNLKTLSLVSYIVYKTNIWEITEAYCDILEYKEGGTRPSVCKGTETDIASLASYISAVCRSVEAYKDVPITSNSDNAFMRLSDLYSGKPVTFKIPNGQWLVNNRWVDVQDKNAVILMKKFVVFLPTESSAKRSVRVEAKVTGWNQHLPPDGTSYVIIPEKKFITQYLEGKTVKCRRESDALTNPYGSSLAKICPLNVDENNCFELLEKTSLFPSIYSQWRVSIFGYQSVPVPEPATEFKLRVGVKLCILDRRSKDKATKRRDGRIKKRKPFRKNSKKLSDELERTSCPDGQYWSVDSRGCVSCPEGSKSALNGYFCVKIPKKD